MAGIKNRKRILWPAHYVDANLYADRAVSVAFNKRIEFVPRENGDPQLKGFF